MPRTLRAPLPPPATLREGLPMKSERVEVLRQGMIAGLLGYAVVALFFAVFNLLAGRPALHTAAALGGVLFYGARDMSDASVGIGAALAYNGVHLLVFLGFGLLAAWLAEFAEHGPHFWYLGAVLLIVFAFHLLGLLLGVSTSLREAVPPWTLVVSGLLGCAAMAGYLLWNHAALRHALHGPIEGT